LTSFEGGAVGSFGSVSRAGSPTELMIVPSSEASPLIVVETFERAVSEMVRREPGTAAFTSMRAMTLTQARGARRGLSVVPTVTGVSAAVSVPELSESKLRLKMVEGAETSARVMV
jgi:hypothetical protein